VVPFAIRITRTSGWCRVMVEGELDLATAPRLELELARLEWRRPRLLLLDPRGLTFMDLTGLRVLLAAHARAERRGHELAILRGSRVVERLLQLLALDTGLNLIDDPAEVPPVRLLQASCRSGGRPTTKPRRGPLPQGLSLMAEENRVPRGP
jgi:anti-sigma B factor antagonist